MPHRLLPAALLVTACAPVFAQTSLRAPLKAWLANQKSPSQYEDSFVPFRKALLRAKNNNGGTDAPLYDVMSAIKPLDKGMESFAAENAGPLPASDVTNLLSLAAAFRENGDSLEPLLPWLLLLQKRGGPDVRVELCLFEAWGADALDCSASKAAAERLMKLDEEKLRAFEAKAFPAGKPGTVKRLVNQLCAGKLDKGKPLGASALGRAFVAELEKDYELAMQLGEFDRAASCLETMLLANPKDLGALLMQEACGGKVKGARFVDRYKGASQDERTTIDARLGHLGFAIVAPGMTVPAAAQAVRDGVTLDFFRDDLDDRVKKLDATIKTSEKAYAAKVDKAKDLREDIAELERKVKKYENIVGMHREVRGWRERIDEKKADAAKADAEAKKELETKTGMEKERSDLQGQIDAVKKRRSEFRLQRAPGEPEPEEPREAIPLQPREPPAPQPAPAAPPLVDLNEELPQAQQVRKGTADLDRGQFEDARKALVAARDALARGGTDATTKRMIAVTRYRVAECLQRLAMQRYRETRNEHEAEVALRDADREFARVTGDDCGTARDGSSLNAAALRSRLVINTTLYCLYRDMAKANPRDDASRKKRDDFAKTANQLLAELKDSYAGATLPDGRNIYEVAKAEAAAALGR
jgi:tetratricopeptide (TPR) repeat protein